MFAWFSVRRGNSVTSMFTIDFRAPEGASNNCLFPCWVIKAILGATLIGNCKWRRVCLEEFSRKKVTFKCDSLSMDTLYPNYTHVRRIWGKNKLHPVRSIAEHYGLYCVVALHFMRKPRVPDVFFLIRRPNTQTYSTTRYIFIIRG